MRIFLALILLLFIVFVSGQVVVFVGKNQAASAYRADVGKQLDAARADYRLIENDYQFYLNPANMEKELRARFNYVLPGEETIILVPRAPTSTD